MKTIVLIKQVPMAWAMTLDPETRTLKREGVRNEVSSFDLRALLRAIALRDETLERCRSLLIELARGYDGADRFYLEAFGLGCEGKEDGLYPQLLAELGDDPLRWSAAFEGIAWRLHPPAALLAFNVVAEADDRISPADIDLLVEKAEVPDHLNQAAPDPAYGDKSPLLRLESGSARVTLFDGGHEIVPAAALGWDVEIFFTFYGLLLLKNNIDAEVSPLGNPAMPMKMPFGPKWFQEYQWPMPNLIMAGIPGFEKLATGLMKKTFQNKGVASIEELRSLCIEADVKMVACQMTVDVFGFDSNEFIPEVTDYVGATSFLPVAQKSDVCLFI